MSDELQQIMEILEQIMEDHTVPKNIRENAKTAKKDLLDESLELSVRVDRARQLLDEVSEDPNLPAFTRTQVWNVVTLLEALLKQ